ncbi:hypothetical protein GCM10009850_102720 [Nonomuraea monospora]|uniref:Uncharacterized protein n=1 Tax=Nonomuraea monospora TaxID=568818 RepID=A0ABP5PX90_9ACTN
MQGHGEHVLVGDGGAADGLAAGAGGFVAFQGAVADVLAFHPRQGGEHGEHHARGVVGALQLAGEELQADVDRLQLLGEGGQVEAAAEPLVLVHHEGDRHARRARFPGQGDGLPSPGRTVARVEIFSAKTRVTPAALSTSSWVSRDWRTVEARAYPIRACPAGAAG